MISMSAVRYIRIRCMRGKTPSPQRTRVERERANGAVRTLSPKPLLRKMKLPKNDYGCR